MATQTQRKVTPTTTLHLAESAGNQRFFLKPTVPDRSTARLIPDPLVRPDRLEHSTSLPILSPSKVHFADLPAPNRPPRWAFKKSATGKVTATSPLVPPPQITQTKMNNRYVGESSKLPSANPKIRQRASPKLDSDAKSVGSNPFADPDIAVDLPDLCEDDDPFCDGDSVSIASTLDLSNSGTVLPEPTVRVVEYGTITPAATPIPDADFKEDQAFFVGLEQFNHPDVARLHFRRKGGVLWDSAVNILMNSYLHPMDLVEAEFVTLVCSQGNTTSNWLRANTRKISSRVIRNRIELHRELTNAGFPPKQMTDEFIELYQAMDDRERKSLLDWLKQLEEAVKLYEKSTDLTSLATEKYMGMTLVEKANFIGLYKLENTRLQRAEEDLEEISALHHSSSTESVGSFGIPLEPIGPRPPSPNRIAPRTGTALTDPAAARLLSGIESAFESHKSRDSPLLHGINSINLLPQPNPPRKLSSFPSASNLVAAVEKFADGAYKRFHSTRKSQASRRREFKSTQNEKNSESDSFCGIDEALKIPLSAPQLTHTLFDDVPSGLLAKIRSGFLSGVSLPTRSLRRTQSHRDMKSNFRLASFDSDAVPLGKFGDKLSTATRAVIAAPTVIQITSTVSVSSVVSEEDKMVSVNRKEVSPPSCCTTNIASTTRNITATRIKRPKVNSSDEGLMDIPEQQFEMAQQYAKAKQELASKSSHWSLRPHRRQNAPRPAESQPAIFESELEASSGRGKQTLRKKLSTIFGTVRTYGKASSSETGKEDATVRRKIFHRKELPSWEFSK